MLPEEPHLTRKNLLDRKQDNSLELRKRIRRPRQTRSLEASTVIVTNEGVGQSSNMTDREQQIMEEF